MTIFLGHMLGTMGFGGVAITEGSGASSRMQRGFGN